MDFILIISIIVSKIQKKVNAIMQVKCKFVKKLHCNLQLIALCKVTKKDCYKNNKGENCCAKVTNWKKVKKYGCKNHAKSIIIYANGCVRLRKVAQRKRRRKYE